MTQTRVLVAFGSKQGGTADIARWIGDELGAAGVPVDVKSAATVRTLDEYGAVVLGGAMYMGRWHRDARKFARRFSRPLSERPVWLFCSGPLDHSAEEPDTSKILGVKTVAKIADRLRARGFAVFGGRLNSDARGFPASAMAKNSAGDFRNKKQIQQWATAIAPELAVFPAAHR